MYKLSIIQFPSGSFGYVGSVPFDLGFVSEKGLEVTLENIESEMRLPSKLRTIKDRVFETEKGAFDFAQKLGYFAQIPKKEAK